MTRGKNDPARVGNVPTVKEPRLRPAIWSRSDWAARICPMILRAWPGQHLASLCGRNPTGAAVEQGLPDFLFELPQLLGNC